MSTSSINDLTTSVSTSGTTSSGTTITTSSGGSMDKTAFLEILCAELSNLDPTEDTDSTTYVTQMAQFASIEQMTNLNDTMTKFAYEQLVGKGVVLTDIDSSGTAIAGTVDGVQTDSSGDTYLYVTYEDDGENASEWFSADDITAITDTSSTTTSAMATTALNTSFMAASSLKGSDVVVSTTDDNDTDDDENTTEMIEVSGTVTSVYIDNGVVMMKITTEDGTTEEYPYSYVTQTSDSQPFIAE
jgi:flagellar basal-body rod modification protein FlgD